MVHKSKPHAGSKGFYPRKRARKETPSFKHMPVSLEAGCRPMNFLAYKAGMTHILGRDAYSKSVTFGQEVFVPVTVLETTPLKVFGIRAYTKDLNGKLQPLMDVFAEKIDKEMEKKQHSFKKPGKKKHSGKKPATKHKTIADFEGAKQKIVEVKLLVFSQPKLAGIPKKTPEISEIALSGNLEQKIAFAKEKLGKEVTVEDVFKEKEFIDIKAVTTGKGTQGPVKRHGIKIQGRKAKRTRAVGSIGPWHPNTLMWQVARSGQMGYQNRTELNKKILKIGTKPEDISEINPANGFKKYGTVKTGFVLLAGSIAGPPKRAIGLRQAIRKPFAESHKLESIDFIATSRKAPSIHIEEGAQKIKLQKEKKEEKKSVADEISAAVKGEKK